MDNTFYQTLTNDELREIEGQVAERIYELCFEGSGYSRAAREMSALYAAVKDEHERRLRNNVRGAYLHIESIYALLGM